MLIAIAALALMAAIFVINDDDDDEAIIQDEELVDENGLTPWGDVFEAATEGDDILVGSNGNNSYFAQNGDDTVAGQGGDDRLFGNDGDDYLLGGTGDDFARGGGGDDILVGGEGDDHLVGDSGDDILQGGAGNDDLGGGNGDDFLIGSAGQDQVSGGRGDDLLFGGDAFDPSLTDEDFTQGLSELNSGDEITIFENRVVPSEDDGFQDDLDGGPGDDVLFVNDRDTATGGAGADIFMLLDGDSTELSYLLDFDVTEDTLVYVYDHGTPLPTLALNDNDDGSQTLWANGEAVSQIVSTGLVVSDIVLVERGEAPA